MRTRYKPHRRYTFSWWLDLAGKAFVRDDHDRQEYCEEKARRAYRDELKSRRRMKGDD